MRLKKLQGILLTCVVAFIPVLLWLAFSPTQIALVDTTQKLDAIAKVAALSGLSLLSFNILLSARLALFERLFMGLDRAYRAHRLIGGSVLILLMIHAASITAKYSSISLLSGFQFLKPSTDIPLMTGKLALAIMIASIAVSIYIKIKYQWFIIVQRLLGAMIFIGGYHALFVTGSDIRNNVPLFSYFILLGGAAACLYIYRSLFHKSIKRKLDYSVDSVWHGEDISVIWLKPVRKELAFYAGQFAFFQFNSEAVDSESHPFSISSGSDNGNIRIAAKASGDYTAELNAVNEGDTVKVEGPYGHFSFTKIRSTKQVWVAGGIGVTPFLSMAQSLPSNYDITLYYCVKNASQAIFFDELTKVASRKKGFKFTLVCNDQGQRITADTLVSTDPESYLLCAPPPMMHALEKQLKGLGISKNSIYYEDFALV